MTIETRHLRLTLSFEDSTELIEKLHKHSERFIIYEHEASERVARTHIHGYVEIRKGAYDTIWNTMKKLTPNDDKGRDRTYSLTYKCKESGKKQPVNKDYISYMSQGILDPKVSKGFEEQEIQDLKAKGYGKPVVTMLKSEHGHLVKEKSPAKKLQIQLLEEMLAELPAPTMLDYVSHADREIFDVIRKVCKRNNYFLPKGLHKVIEFRDNIRLYLDNKPDVELLKQEYDNALARRLR